MLYDPRKYNIKLLEDTIRRETFHKENYERAGNKNMVALHEKNIARAQARLLALIAEK